MSNKKTYIAMGIVFALIVGYTIFVKEVIWPKHPNWNTTGAPIPAEQPEMKSAGSANNEPGTAPTTTVQNMMPATAPTALRAIGTEQAGPPVVLGSIKPNDPNVAIGLSVSAMGAGLDSVNLNEAKEIDAKEMYQFQQPYPGHDDTRSLAAQTVTVNGHAIDLLGVTWKQESASAMSATYGVDIVSSDGKPVLHVSKTYEVTQKGSNKGPAGD